MFVRNRQEVPPVDWGNGESHRLLTEDDKMGFTICHTVVKAGSSSKLQYRRHFEACYCIAGSGEVRNGLTNERHRIEPGVLYALNQHDPHLLLASPTEDLHLVSVFNPPLNGDERHRLSDDGYSQY